MYNSLTLTPAYGRDYRSKATLMADWESGKDFYGRAGPVANRAGFRDGYTSIRDLDRFKQDGITHLHFRYQHQTKVHVVKL